MVLPARRIFAVPLIRLPPSPHNESTRVLRRRIASRKTKEALPGFGQHQRQQQCDLRGIQRFAVICLNRRSETSIALPAVALRGSIVLAAAHSQNADGNQQYRRRDNSRDPAPMQQELRAEREPASFVCHGLRRVGHIVSLPRMAGRMNPSPLSFAAFARARFGHDSSRSSPL